jgi:hypothetical protein
MLAGTFRTSGLLAGEEPFSPTSFTSMQHYAALLAAQSQMRAPAQQSQEQRSPARVYSTGGQGVPQVCSCLSALRGFGLECEPLQ